MSTIHANVPYAGATSPRQCMDIHLPDGSTALSPLLVYVHGKSLNRILEPNRTDARATNLKEEPGDQVRTSSQFETS